MSKQLASNRCLLCGEPLKDEPAILLARVRASTDYTGTSVDEEEWHYQHLLWLLDGGAHPERWPGFRCPVPLTEEEQARFTREIETIEAKRAASVKIVYNPSPKAKRLCHVQCFDSLDAPAF